MYPAVVAKEPSTWVDATAARISIPLRAEIATTAELVAGLNADPRDLVRATTEGEHVVIRPTARPEWSGLPVHYSGRPTFRGSIERDANYGSWLSGSVDRPAGPLLFNLILAGGAALGALAGLLIIGSGDLSGLILLVAAAGIGVAAIVGWKMQQALVAKDEDQLRRALAEYSRSHDADWASAMSIRRPDRTASVSADEERPETVE